MIVGSSVNDERTFSMMNMLCGETMNKLTTHLELCTRFMESNEFDFKTFPWKEASETKLPDYVSCATCGLRRVQNRLVAGALQNKNDNRADCATESGEKCMYMQSSAEDQRWYQTCLPIAVQ